MTATTRAANLLALLLFALAPRAGAQHLRSFPVIPLGSDADERLRIRSIVAPSPAEYPLLRSTSTFAALFDRSTASTTWEIGVALPELRATRNSELPFSLNDGAQWAGRGWSTSATAALTARYGPLRLIAAPTYTSAQNAPFQVIPFRQDVADRRNVWANPFHPLPESIDFPLRFGDRRISKLYPGQSSLTVDAGPLRAGVATENLWWGPGIRNAITLSNNSAGFPHALLETARPVRTRAGTFDGQWILGRLSESDFFDSDRANDDRSLAGLALVWRTPFDTTLSIGATRLVMGARSPGVGSAFDVFRSAGHLNVDTAVAVPDDARDQITSFFARWVFPSSGFEAYAEWARFEEPRSFRDYLEYPGHSEGYTLGLQWARPLFDGLFRLQAEASYLEPDPSLRLRPTAVTYTSRGVPQGFTNRGQVLGASIGPGSSSQWLAGELFRPHWRVGPYLSRIRWDNGTMEEPIVPFFKRQDVTLLAGLRAGVSAGGADLIVDFAHGARFNYLFQSYVVGMEEQTAGIDLINNTLSVTLSINRWWR